MKLVGNAWTLLGPNGFTPGRANYPSLALDSSSTPHVSFMDETTTPTNKLSVMKYTAGTKTWSMLGAAGISDGAVQSTNLAFTPFVAFKDMAFQGKTTVMKWTGAVWVVVGSKGCSYGEVGLDSLSLAIDASGTPWISFKDLGQPDLAATVMKYTGAGITGWAVVGTAGFSAGRADYVDLAFDASGKPHVAYADYYQASVSIKAKPTVMSYNN